MIDESIVNTLNKKGEPFQKLLQFMKETNIPFKDRKLNGALGLTVIDCVYLNLEQLNRVPNSLYCFVILHEIAHYKRIAKLGKDDLIKNLSSDNFDVFCNYIINEEIIADRYGCYTYKCITDKIYPQHETQQLNRDYKKEQYKLMIKNWFGVVQNKEENYIKLMESVLA